MSFIPRLYLTSAPSFTEQYHLDASSSRYLVRVLRMREGHHFWGFDAQGSLFDMGLIKADPEHSIAQVISKKENISGINNVHIALGQSLPKSNKLDLILQQGTEIGIHRFIPLMTERSISRPQLSQYGHKKKRWEKIILEATRQCARTDVPHLDGITGWQECLRQMKDFDQVLMPYEKEAPTLKTVLESKPFARRILVLIGPEGGWAAEEINSGEQCGASPVHLATPILRTETAGIVVVAMIQFYKSSNDGEIGSSEKK